MGERTTERFNFSFSFLLLFCFVWEMGNGIRTGGEVLI